MGRPCPRPQDPALTRPCHKEVHFFSCALGRRSSGETTHTPHEQGDVVFNTRNRRHQRGVSFTSIKTSIRAAPSLKRTTSLSDLRPTNFPRFMLSGSCIKKLPMQRLFIWPAAALQVELSRVEVVGNAEGTMDGLVEVQPSPAPARRPPMQDADPQCKLLHQFYLQNRNRPLPVAKDGSNDWVEMELRAMFIPHEMGWRRCVPGPWARSLRTGGLIAQGGGGPWTPPPPRSTHHHPSALCLTGSVCNEA